MTARLCAPALETPPVRGRARDIEIILNDETFVIACAAVSSHAMSDAIGALFFEKNRNTAVTGLMNRLRYI
jgi:hypothetical protein